MLSTRADPPRFLDLPKTPRHGSTTFKQYLLNSPLPSPSLPSILPRHGKKPPRLNTKKALRALCWLTVLTSLIWVWQRAPQTALNFENLIYESSNGKEYQIVGADHLPSFASPVAVTDRHGHSKWSVSIPSSLHFPLSSTDYDDICLQAEDVSTHVANSRHNLHKVQGLRFGQSDPNYVDIAEAQDMKLLPKTNFMSTPQNGQQICEKSLTYVLDASEAGLGDALIGLWLSYGLAQRQERAFFIDYSDFAYGKFTSLFSKLPPTPNCRPPPWEERTPCPHFARHLVVGPSTLKWTFGLSFREQYSTKEIFKMARDGYEALFNMRDDDKEYVEGRLSELRDSLQGTQGHLIGVHIRRGDRHPFEFQYQHGYLPPSKYVAAAQEIAKPHSDSVVVVASDDADIYHHSELEGTVRAQDRIKLASKKHLDQGGLGWEGGFFKDAFWDIGLPEHAVKQKYIGSPEPTRKKQQTLHGDEEDQERDYKSQPTKDALQLREYIGRAYLLDLAVLAGSDEVVCGVSSKGCRILAIMMGWDKLHQGHWRNVDGDHGWKALF